MTGSIHPTSKKLSLISLFEILYLFSFFLSLFLILFYMRQSHVPLHLIVGSRQEVSHPSTEHDMPSWQLCAPCTEWTAALSFWTCIQFKSLLVENWLVDWSFDFCFGYPVGFTRDLYHWVVKCFSCHVLCMSSPVDCQHIVSSDMKFCSFCYY